MNGIIVINKPKNYTSFDVVAVMRKLFSQKKVGHAGTLDPMATGVLPILLGSATKAQDMFPNSDKEYISDFKLGITTDTLDITGKILTTSDIKIEKRQVEEELNHFRGAIKQVPPMYSALKKNGKKLYEFARKGIEVKREGRDIFIKELELIDFDEVEKSGSIRVLCSKGTYIRSLCDDLGRRLGCGAIMTDLKRTMACGFRIDDSVSIDKLKSVSESEIEKYVVGVESIFNYPSVNISESQSKRFKNGGSLDLFRTSLKDNCEDNGKFCVYYKEKFLGLGIISKKEQELKIYKLF